MNNRRKEKEGMRKAASLARAYALRERRENKRQGQQEKISREISTKDR